MSRSHPTPHLRAWLAPCLLLAIGALTYANSLAGVFIFEDVATIVDNERIRHVYPLFAAPQDNDQAPVEGRPLVRLSLALNYAMGGLDVRGYHLVNIAIHLLAALALCGIVRRTLLGPGIAPHLSQAAGALALSCALLWMVHPLQNQCVNYITQRAESLMGLFYLLTLYSSIRTMETESRGWLAAAVLCCALGMATKEVMVTAPVMVLVYDRVYRADSFAGALRRRGPLYLGLACAWILLAGLMAWAPHGKSIGLAGGVSPWTYALNQCVVLLDYLRKAFWPAPLALDYGYPVDLSLGDVWVQAAVLVGLCGMTAAALVLRPKIGYMPAWFWVILAPTSSLVPIVNEVGAERRVYLPLAGLAALVVVAGYSMLSRWVPARRHWLGALLVAGATLSLAWASVQRNADYRSRESIWRSAVAAVPTSPRAHANLGVELRTQGRLEEALRHYRRALELRPDHAETHYNLANILKARGLYAEAVDHYRRVLELRPDAADAYNNLGAALDAQGKLEEAIGQYRRALELQPDYAPAHFNLANALQAQERYAEAVPHYRQVLRLRPDLPEAHLYLGMAMESLGHPDSAATRYHRVLELLPGNTEAERGLRRTEDGQDEPARQR